MKIACLTNSYGRFGPQAAIRLLPDAGIRRLELPIRNAGVPSFFKETPLLTNLSTEAELVSVQERIAAAGMEICTCNVTAGNPLEAEVLERTLQKLGIAARFDVRYVVAGGGEISSADQWPQLVRHLRRIGDEAAAHGMIYCCETHPGVCRDAGRMLEMLERVDHPQVRINFDTGNIFYYNEGIDLLDQMRHVLPYIEHVHLKDTSGRFGEWHFPALGAGGAVDFRAVRRLLEERGYAGPWSLEIEGIEGEPEPSLDQYQRRITESLRHLETCGYEISHE